MLQSAESYRWPGCSHALLFDELGLAQGAAIAPGSDGGLTTGRWARKFSGGQFSGGQFSSTLHATDELTDATISTSPPAESAISPEPAIAGSPQLSFPQGTSSSPSLTSQIELALTGPFFALPTPQTSPLGTSTLPVVEANLTTAQPDAYYHITLTQASQVSINLTGLTANADFDLLDDRNTLLASANLVGSVAERLNTSLAAGTYTLHVYSPEQLVTPYRLNADATALVLPNPNYSRDFGYGLVDAARAVALALGNIAPLPTVIDPTASWNNSLVGAPAAWAQGYTGQGVTVAIIDGGVNYTHPDLSGNLWSNRREIAGNGLDDDGNGYIDDLVGWDFIDRDNTPFDLDGHGSHVAGIVAAANDNIGMTGVAYGANIMPIRVLDPQGNGNYGELSAGIRYAADNGAKVINLSLGGSYSAEVESAIQYAIGRGAYVVSAAGNQGSLQPTFPGILSDRWGVTVGSLNQDRSLRPASNRAGASPLNYVVAPGGEIYSTVLGSGYALESGTSMAAPHVAGIVALMLSANPNLTPTQIDQILARSASYSNLAIA